MSVASRLILLTFDSIQISAPMLWIEEQSMPGDLATALEYGSSTFQTASVISTPCYHQLGLFHYEG